jgi:hypothetical protein
MFSFVIDIKKVINTKRVFPSVICPRNVKHGRHPSERGGIGMILALLS